MFKGFVEVYKEGVLIGVYEGNADCARALNLDNRNISACILGRQRTHKGYTFKRLEK